MDNSALISELKSAQKALEELKGKLDIALRLAGGDLPELAPGKVEGSCNVCKKPLYQNDEKRRGLHLACYNKVYAEYIQSGKYTTEDLEAMNIFDPPAKPGRKPRDVRDLEKRIASAKKKANQVGVTTSQKIPKGKANSKRRKKSDE